MNPQIADDLTALEAKWLRRFERERKGRKEAEQLLEQKSLELFNSNVQLRALADSLEMMVAQRTEELAEALQQAQRATAAKSDFLATMSHEIRTPMNGVLGMTDILLETPLNDEQLYYMRVIKNCSQTLLTIINDILDLSKIEAGKLELERIPFKLKHLLDELLEIFRPQIRDKGLKLFSALDSDLPGTLLGDPTRLRQIFFNLLSNAIKFTDTGAITVQLQTTATPGLLQATVKDTGIGIAQEAQAQLFSAFNQADVSITRQYGGTGLGLAICARLSAMMGGQIWVESQAGHGAAFHFTFAAPAVASAPEEAASVAQTLVALAHLRVLLVEDNAINRAIARKMIEKLGITLDIAHDGLQALCQVEQNRYDIILMDMQMPNMDGLTATRRIRAMDIKQPRIIALTANAFNEDRQACRDAGMDDFLTKPISLDKITEKLSEYSAHRIAD
ncbi:MAG: response regulator [Candidatus Methylumidiphilus sp.]